MNRKIEEQLHKNFDPIAPDYLSDIKDAKISRIDSEDLLFSELQGSSAQSNRRYRFRYGIMIAAIFVCLLTVFIYQRNYATVEIVTVETEASVRLSLNRANKVIHVEIKDEDDLKESELLGKSFEDSLGLVLDSLTKSTDGRSAKKVVISCKSRSKKNTVKKMIKKAIGQYADYEFDVTSSSQSAKNTASGDDTQACSEESIQDQEKTADAEGTSQEDISTERDSTTDGTSDRDIAEAAVSDDSTEAVTDSSQDLPQDTDQSADVTSQSDSEDEKESDVMEVTDTVDDSGPIQDADDSDSVFDEDRSGSESVTEDRSGSESVTEDRSGSESASDDDKTKTEKESLSDEDN